MKALASALVFLVSTAQADQKLTWDFNSSVVNKKNIFFDEIRDTKGRALIGMHFEQWDSENSYLAPMSEQDIFVRSKIRRELSTAALAFCENNYLGSISMFESITYEAWQMDESVLMLEAKNEREDLTYGTENRNKLIRNFFPKIVEKDSVAIVLTGVECAIVPEAVSLDNTFGGFLRSSRSPLP